MWRARERKQNTCVCVCVCERERMSGSGTELGSELNKPDWVHSEVNVTPLQPSRFVSERSRDTPGRVSCGNPTFLCSLALYHVPPRFCPRSFFHLTSSPLAGCVAAGRRGTQALSGSDAADFDVLRTLGNVHRAVSARTLEETGETCRERWIATNSRSRSFILANARGLYA